MERWDGACDELEALERAGALMVRTLLCGCAIATLLVVAMLAAIAFGTWRLVLR